MTCTTPRAQFPPKLCKASTVYSIVRHATLLLFFLAHLIFSSRDAFAQDDCSSVSTLIVNTGRDPVSGTLYPIESTDGFWRITSDHTIDSFSIGYLPRCADVIEKNPFWADPQAPSQWIAPAPTYSNNASYVTTYTREFCIGVIPAPPEIYAKLWILVDGTATVYLDGHYIGTASGYTTPDYVYGMVEMFDGIHTLEVVVVNDSRRSTGLNLIGTLEAKRGGLLRTWLFPDGCCTKSCKDRECLTEQLTLATNSTWMLMDDPHGGILPRCASEIPVRYPNWGAELPGSSWIGPNSTGSTTTHGSYSYLKSFEVSKETTLQMEVSVMADDAVDVYLDHTLIFSVPNWAGSPPQGISIPIVLKAGCHYIRFEVHDLEGKATGLNALVDLFGDGLVKDECATCIRCSAPPILKTTSGNRNLTSVGASNLEVSPNPSTSTINISYLLERTANTRLELYNSVGELVSTLDAGPQDAGEYRRSYTPAGLPAGLYLLRLNVDGQMLSTSFHLQ